MMMPLGTHIGASPLSDRPEFVAMLVDAMLKGLAVSMEVAGEGRE